MTKEPNKDFRQAVREVMANAYDSELCNYDNLVEIATDNLLALCKEMLVPAEKSVKYLHRGNDGSKQIGWNACRSELLKQLGEK